MAGGWVLTRHPVSIPPPASGAGEGPSCGRTKWLRWRMEAGQVRSPLLLHVPGTGSALGFQPSRLGGGSCLRTRGQWGLRRSFTWLQAGPSLQILGCTEACPPGEPWSRGLCERAPSTPGCRGPGAPRTICSVPGLPTWRPNPGSLRPSLACPPSLTDQRPLCGHGCGVGSGLPSHLVSEPGGPVPCPAELSLVCQKELCDMLPLPHE